MTKWVKVLLRNKSINENNLNKKSVYYKIGLVLCEHSGGYCVQFETNVDLKKSEHSTEPNVYFVSRNKIVVDPMSENILKNLQQRWNTLVFREVKTILVKIKNVEYARRYQYKQPPDELVADDLQISGDDEEEVQIDLDKLEECSNVRMGFTHYHGYTKPIQIDDDLIEGIFFKRNRRAYLSFDLNTMGSWIKDNIVEPPVKDQLLCGVVLKHKGIYSYNYWFECSKQFYLLYLLVMFGRDHEEFKNKNTNQIRDMLETNRQSKIINF